MTPEPIRESQAHVETRRAPLSPFDAPKAHFLGILLTIPVVLLLGPIAANLPDTVLVLFAARVIASRKGVSFAEAVSLRPVPAGILALPIALAVVAKSVEVIILSGIDWLSGDAVTRWSDLFSSPLTGESMALDVLLACTLVPVVEELFFRGFYQSSLKDMGYGWSVILPSLLFASWHHPMAIPGAFVIAVFGGVLTAKTGSVIPAIVFHAAANCWVMTAGLIQERYTGLAGAISYWALCIGGAVLGLRIRPELRQIVSDSMLAWRDFWSRPAFIEKSRKLFRHWTYILLIIEVALIVFVIVWTTVKGPLFNPD